MAKSENSNEKTDAPQWSTKQVISLLFVLAPLLGIGGNQALGALSDNDVKPKSTHGNCDVSALKSSMDTAFAQIKQEIRSDRQEFRSELEYNRKELLKLMEFQGEIYRRVTFLVNEKHSEIKAKNKFYANKG